MADNRRWKFDNALLKIDVFQFFGQRSTVPPLLFIVSGNCFFVRLTNVDSSPPLKIKLKYSIEKRIVFFFLLKIGVEANNTVVSNVKEEEVVDVVKYDDDGDNTDGSNGGDGDNDDYM